MSTFICEPGSRLGGRYRLEDRVNSSSGWSVWKAIDETLARPVTVLTLAPGFPRTTEAVTAARAASRLTDARVAQVFDVEEDWDQAYVVMEWVGGESLTDLLAEGPLDPAQAARIVAQAAGALASAHAAGLAHLCLTPESLRWTHGGGVKISGIGVEAALTGAHADDPALTDTVALARLLYAAVTGLWPGEDWTHLPPAPLSPDGRPRTPRQVRAGVPAGIDEVTSLALFQRERHQGPPIATPALLADALAAVIPAQVVPPPAAPMLGREPRWAQAARDGAVSDARWDDSGAPPWRVSGSDMPGRAFPTRTVVGAVVALALAAIGIGAALTLGHHSSSAPPGTVPSTGPSSRAPNAPAVLTPVRADGFDPLSSPADDPSNENDAMAPKAIDGNTRTSWKTQFYLNNPAFAGLKAGAGLILDMGHPVRLSSVTVTFGRVPGADVQIEIGNDNTRSRAALDSFTTVASGNDLGGTYTFAAHGNATGRYVLIWFTKLPPKAGSANRYMAQVFNVVVRGSS